MGRRLVRVGMALVGASVSGGCDIFHSTDWSNRCATAPDSPECQGAASTHASDGGHGGSPTGSGSGAGGATGATGAVGASGGAQTGGRAVSACDGVPEGVEFESHCYTNGSLMADGWNSAIAECEALTSDSGAQGHLMVLDSVAEVGFVVENFLEATATEKDAWIGLECNAATAPDITSCYCNPCVDQAELESKRANWSWIDGLVGGFTGWHSDDPNAGSRCAALSMQDGAWGIVDRDCASVSFVVDGLPRTYRTVCELQ